MLNLHMLVFENYEKAIKIFIPSSLMNLTNFIKESCFVAIMTKQFNEINKDLQFYKGNMKSHKKYIIVRF